MKSVMIALIHNNNPERLMAMREVIATLRAQKLDGFKFSSVEEFFEQPEKLSASLFFRAKWVIENGKTKSQMRLSEARHLKKSGVVAWLLGATDTLLYAAQQLREALVGEMSSARHFQVARKHGLAWLKFRSDKNSDLLLVLEDDALLKDPSRLKTLGAALAFVESGDRPTFLLASEGLPYGLLGEGFNLAPGSEGDFWFPPTPFTNTTAAYFINKNLANQFCKSIDARPGLTFNAIDFLINALLNHTAIKSCATPIRCAHLTRPIFLNGSISGEFGSMISLS
jgi:hypothetical protein